jgi:hypothetical protein
MTDAVIGWDEKRPPASHYVMASYEVMDPLRLMKTCRHGCCVDAGFGPQMLPRYWRDATQAEIDDCWWVKKDRERQARKEDK